MAETITLRAYLNQLESLLERDSLVEVISHCRYILQHYPQNVETYRLLARSLLQRGQSEGAPDSFKEAAEVFQRVLSVLPNDYVAHLGMSEIYEHDKAMNEAIWHLERAYEQLPGNQMLQQGLRELYIKRDGPGHASEKIQLTRAALARQYINGQLYDQALIELRTALQQNADRVDLQVLLAETLWESQHPIEAAEVAFQIVKRLPNCLPANRIMARLWLDNERPTDAQPYLDRLEAVDPYAAANVVRPDAEVPDQVTLARLDYQTQAQVASAAETPSWVHELGDLSEGFDMSSVFQTPADSPAPSVPPARPDTKAVFGAQSGDQAPWIDQPTPSFVADAVPDWFADLEGGFNAPSTPAAQPPAPATEKPGDEPALSAEIPDWFADVLAEKPAAPPAKPAAVDAEWLMGDETGNDAASLSSLEALFEEAPAQSSAVDADWLLGEDEEAGAAPMPSLDALSGTPPAQPSAVDADWLMGDEEPGGAAPVTPSWSESQPETPLAEPSAADLDWLLDSSQEVGEAVLPPSEVPAAPVPAEPLAAEPDWLWAADEKGPEPLWPVSEPPVEPAEEKPSSGFTGLLEEIESARVASHLLPELSDSEPMAPAWLTDFDEDQSALQAGVPQSTAAEPAVPLEDLLGASGEELTFDSFESLEQQAAFAWPPSEGEPAPAADQSPAEAAPAVPEDDVAFLASFDAPLPNLEDTFAAAPEPAAEAPAPAEDWLSDLREASDLWGDAQELSAAPDILGDLGEELPAQPEFSLEEPVELASELPDWIQEVAPEVDAQAPAPLASETFEEAAPAAPSAAEQRAVELPTPPVVDEDMMALFETHEKVLSPDEVWTTPETSAEFQVSEAELEPETEPELDWLQPAAAEDDWLGSFAKPAAEASTPVEMAGSEPLSLDALAAPSETSDQQWWGASAQANVQPADRLEQGDEWLASMADLQLEDVPEAALGERLSFETAEPAVSEPLPELDLEESELPVESPESGGRGVTSRLLSSLADMQKGGSEADSPAWLADMEPVKSGEEAVSFNQQPYDPFEAGSPDNVPQYLSAKDTGILQPDEKLDWMTAFTGEELPPLEPEETVEPEPALDLGRVESSPQVEPADLAPMVSDDLLSDLRQEVEAASPEEAYFLDAETGGFDLPKSDEPEGAMPDWLAAITKSETDKYRDILPAEPESYSASDSGVLQPGSEPDWLQGIETSPPSAEAPADKETSEAPSFDSLEDLFAQAEKAEAESFDLDFSDVAPLDQAIADLALEKPAAQPADLFDSDFEAQDAWADLPAFREDEVAQPADLADTRQTEQVMDEAALSDDDLDDEEVPDDLSFGDLLPLALRRASSSSLDNDSSRQGKEIPPDWLSDVFKDGAD